MHPSSDEIWSLLFVAANEGCQAAFRALMIYDKEHTQVFVGGGMNLTSDNSSTKVASGAALQQLEQLLLTCLTASQVELITLVIEEAPAVALLSECTCTIHGHLECAVYSMVTVLNCLTHPHFAQGAGSATTVSPYPVKHALASWSIAEFVCYQSSASCS
jgi:hypothetical protein